MNHNTIVRSLFTHWYEDADSFRKIRLLDSILSDSDKPILIKYKFIETNSYRVNKK